MPMKPWPRRSPGIDPGGAPLAADLVSGSDPIVNPKPFRYSRMIDGTRLPPNAGAVSGLRRQRPFHTGARFSAKARAPSKWSSLP